MDSLNWRRFVINAEFYGRVQGVVEMTEQELMSAPNALKRLREILDNAKQQLKELQSEPSEVIAK